jgi:hypothetical protein
MSRRLAVLFLLTLPAFAAERPPAKAIPTPVPTPFPTLETFQLFIDSRLYAPIRLELPGERNSYSIRQPGDPDSVISPGAPTPSNHFAVKPAFEVNDILLKAYQPDPTVDPHDNKTRGAGVFSPLDAIGRPLQLRFGARLVW